MDDLIGEFISETSEALAALDGELARKPGDPHSFALVGKLLHTIKGPCGFLGLKRLETVSGAGEALLAKIKPAAHPQGAPLVLEMLGRIRTLVDYVATVGHEPEGDDNALIESFTHYAPAPRSKPPLSAVEVETVIPAATTLLPQARAEGMLAEMKGNSVRVNRELFGGLMAMVGELVHTRNQLLHAARSRSDTILQAPLKHLSHMIAEIQTRMTKAQVAVPGSMAILPTLYLGCNGQKFGLPQTALREIIPLGLADSPRVETVAGAQMLHWHGTLLPVKSLADVLGVPANAAGAPSYVAVLDAGCALLVDALEGSEETVARPISCVLKKVGLYSGTALAGDGSIVLLLDAPALAARLTDGKAASPAAQATLPATLPINVLLFRTGSGAPKAVAVEHVVRLRTLAAAAITHARGQPMMDYDNQPIRLTTLAEMAMPTTGEMEVIVLGIDQRFVGLAVSGVMDLALATPTQDVSGSDGPYLGSAIVAGKTVELVDAAALLEEAR